MTVTTEVEKRRKFVKERLLLLRINRLFRQEAKANGYNFCEEHWLNYKGFCPQCHQVAEFFCNLTCRIFALAIVIGAVYGLCHLFFY